LKIPKENIYSALTQLNLNESVRSEKLTLEQLALLFEKLK